jgi:hypothetical protein
MMHCPQLKRLMASYPVKISWGDMREMGVDEVLIYRLNRCGHHTELSPTLGGTSRAR